MRKRVILTCLVASFALNLNLARAEQTVTTMTSKYTGWTVGAGVYWTDGQGHYTSPSGNQVGHSPGVAFTLPDLPAGSLVDIGVADATAAHGLGPLSGIYYLYGEGKQVKTEVKVGPFYLAEDEYSYSVTLFEKELVASGRFCGGISGISVPSSATELMVIGDQDNSCPQINPGTEGIVTARFWLNG